MIQRGSSINKIRNYLIGKGINSEFIKDTVNKIQDKNSDQDFFSAIKITNFVIEGEEVKLILFNISDGLSITFNVYPLGAIFGLVASGLWILASIYSIGYMRGNKESHQTRFFSFYYQQLSHILSLPNCFLYPDFYGSQD